MQQALETMIDMQNRMNVRVHAQWQEQDFAWYRAIWIECAELLDHYGYKWWKRQQPEMEQVRLEVVDIWHFGLSALLVRNSDPQALAAEIARQLAAHAPATADVREATEALALSTLQSQSFSVTDFWDLMLASGLNFADLYTSYVGKNVLNFFRQDNGYQDGSYRKLWSGREDNEHLSELVRELDADAEAFPDNLYTALGERYRAAD